MWNIYKLHTSFEYSEEGKNTTRLLSNVCKLSKGEALDIYEIINITKGSLNKWGLLNGHLAAVAHTFQEESVPQQAKPRSLRNLEMCLSNAGAPKHQLLSISSLFSLFLFGFLRFLCVLWLCALQGTEEQTDTEISPSRSPVGVTRRRQNASAIICVGFIDWVALPVTVRDGTCLLTVVLLLQGCVQRSGIDAEISWSAQLDVLHQIYLQNTWGSETSVLLTFKAFFFWKSLCVFW